jgi:hypothetical protein
MFLSWLLKGTEDSRLVSLLCYGISGSSFKESNEADHVGVRVRFGGVIVHWIILWSRDMGLCTIHQDASTGNFSPVFIPGMLCLAGAIAFAPHSQV